MLVIGSILDGRYEILKEIGRGGMSVVYLAMDNRLNKSVAVKDIRKEDHINQELLMNSLVAEANTLKKLDHAFLPKIYDIIESGEDIYVVMDYIDGETLQEKFNREGPISAEYVIDWAKKLSDVLNYLHTRKPNPIIYRDMKPGNIMLTPEGDIKLIDFGISREYKEESITDTTSLGTKIYAAPEQLIGKQTDARTDIYSLGLTIYYLVTGKSIAEPPFEIMPIRYWDPTLPEALEYIIDKCTRSEPNDRYQSCEELLYDLENINKLTKSYKKEIYKRFIFFVIPVTFLFLFSITSLLGFHGIKKEKFQDYMNLINEAIIAQMDGDDVRSIELLEQAIQVDDKRSNAYINLLDIYINRDDVDTGLAKIESYINDKYGNVHKNNEILFKVGMIYFDVKRDYHSALKYFRMVDDEEIEAVQYYKSLATTMSSLNIDYEEFAKRLLEFDEYNESLPNDQRKIENYYALANIFLSYKSQIKNANTIAINIIQKAMNLLNILDDEQLNGMYESSFQYKIAQAYYSRAIHSTSQSKAREDYQKAIEYFNQLIEQDVPETENHLVTVGIIFREMKEYKLAREQFEKVIQQYPDNVHAYIELGDLLIDQELNKREKQRNFTKVLEIFEEVKDIEKVYENDSFQKFVRRLENLNLFMEGE